MRLALQAEGIEAVILDPNAAGYMGFAGRIRVAVVNDADFSKAHAVLVQLEPPPTPPLPSWRYQKAGVLLNCVAGVLLLATGFWVDRFGPDALSMGMFGISIVLTVIGIALIFLGPLADKRSA